jgi:LysM repeat protein
MKTKQHKPISVNAENGRKPTSKSKKVIKAYALVWNINVPGCAKEGDLVSVELQKPVTSNEKIWKVVPVTITINTK